jgi:Phosphatidate cytidylyltransferase, mitochondrial
VDASIAANLDAAFAATLLLLPPRFTTQQLLEAVTGLSYTADIRMSFAEDSNKVGRLWVTILSHYTAFQVAGCGAALMRCCSSCRNSTVKLPASLANRCALLPVTAKG